MSCILVIETLILLLSQRTRQYRAM